jgi:hypothetical protein
MRGSSSLFSRAWVAVAELGVLASCDLGNMNPFWPDIAVTHQDCATLSTQSWSVGSQILSDELELGVGQSKEESLSPPVQAQCESSLTSVTWTADDPAVAAVLPQSGRKDSVWITGVAPGLTAVRARIVFSDGRTVDATPEPIKVVPAAPPPGSGVVAHGSVPMDAPAPGSGPVRAWVTFTLRAAGTVEVSVDWQSPLNDLSFSVFRGTCSAASGACGDLAMPAVGNFHVKPISTSAILSAGDYSIMIDNAGPGAETAYYEVRLTPQ